MTKYKWVYMTAADMEEAKTIGRFLVESRLAACVNIIDNMNSLYWWEGEVQEAGEVVVIAKTVNVKVPELIDKVKSMHSYECPCILVFSITAGNMDFFKWMDAQTSS